jgi:hypothetical protein
MKIGFIGLGNMGAPRRMTTRAVRDAFMIHSAEFDIGGFLLPVPFVACILGFMASWAITGLMEFFRLTRYVWHLPLFFAGVALLIAGLLALLF